MSDVPPGIRNYFRRKEHFRKLLALSTRMNKLYDEFPPLRSLLVENIDLQESPSMNYENVQRDLFAKMGVRIETVEGGTKITHDPAAMNLDALTSHVRRLIEQAILNEKITDINTLEEIIQWHYENMILKWRYMGFKPKVLIYDVDRYWHWCANIDSLCTGFLLVFDRFAREEVLTFPFLDKYLHGTAAACNSLMKFIQEQERAQTPTLVKEDLRLPPDDRHVGQQVKPVSPHNPRGGIIPPHRLARSTGRRLDKNDCSKKQRC